MSGDLEKLAPATRKIVQKIFDKMDQITASLDAMDATEQRLDDIGKPKVVGLHEMNKMIARRSADD